MSVKPLFCPDSLRFGLITAIIFLLTIIILFSASTNFLELTSEWQFKVFLGVWTLMAGWSAYGLRRQYLSTIDMVKCQYPNSSAKKANTLGKLFYRQKYFKGFALTLALFPLSWIVLNLSLPKTAIGITLCIACLSAAILIYLSIPTRHR